jgi:multisubunit Na+/H+ antiporter MnhF subunit
MRSFELIIAVIVAVVVFALLKLIGLIVKFALIAGVLGFIAGLILARSLRPRSS